MGRVFLNPVVADSCSHRKADRCSHPKADLTDGRQHRSGSQAAKEEPAALSLSEMKCSQVILAYTKKHSCLLSKLNCNILICLSTSKYGLHLLVLFCNEVFCKPNKRCFYILHCVNGMLVIKSEIFHTVKYSLILNSPYY